MKPSPDDSIPTRYSLLSRLQDRQDQESWRDFYETYWRLILSVGLKSGLTASEAQDVVQETLVCVVRDLEKFKRQRQLGSFKAWLRQLTRWRIADQLRKRIPTGGSRPETEEQPDLEEKEAFEPFQALWEEEWHKHVFEAALARVKRQVKEEHYQIFDLYVLKEWPPAKVAQVLNVTVSTVYLAKHRVGQVLKRELRGMQEDS